MSTSDPLSGAGAKKRAPLHQPRTPRFLSEVPTEKVVKLFAFQTREDTNFPPLPSPRPKVDLHKQSPARPQGPLSELVTEAANTPPEPLPGVPSPELVAAAVFKETQRERDRLVRAVEALRLQSERLAEQARADAIEIAFQIAQRIVDTELRTSPEPLFGLVRSALKQAGEARRVQLRVHPEDGVILRANAQQVAQAAPAVAKMEILDDSSLERGDCLVDTDFGEIDGRLSTRFAELRRALVESGEQGTGEGGGQ
jgi:flagellar assembly protein FliH